MISIRISGFSRLLCVAAVSALPVMTAAPAHAQQFAGFRNSRVSTSGDAQNFRFRPQIRGLPGINFSTIGLFGDSEVFGQFSAPRQFIYALPDFSSSGLDFTEWTFQEYLQFAANSYQVADTDQYQRAFVFRNSFSVTNNRSLFEGFGDLSATFDLFLSDRTEFFRVNPQLDTQTKINYTLDPTALPSALNDAAFDRIHGQDFVAGGGFPGFGAPTTPTGGDGQAPLPNPLPTPTSPLSADPTDTSDDGQLASDIAPIVDSLGGDNGGTDIVVPTSASQAQTQAANVSAVPEPATLGLLAMGTTAMLGRRRR